MVIEKNRASIESSRNSCSSSCSSSTFSSFESSKRVQTEWQLPYEPTSPNLHKKQPEWSFPPTDIRDVVKDSMTRVIRVTKNERALVKKRVDSPRPFIHQKSIQYETKDQNIAKTQKISSTIKKVKETSRFSCDEMESQYSLKSSFKVKELPRLSLDSKPESKAYSMNESRSEPESNKRPSSGIVARLMGLDSLIDSHCEAETVKVKPAYGDHLGSGSPKAHSKIKPALQKEGGDQGSKKPPGYGEIEKILSALGFKTLGEDLKALKQIVEAMQMTKAVFENKEKSLDSSKNDQPGLTVLNRAAKPGKMTTEHLMVTDLKYANHKTKKRVKDSTQRNSKVIGRTPRSLLDLNGERPVSSPRLQRSKKGIDKQCFDEPSSDSSRIKKQSDLKTSHLKIMPIDQSCMSGNETRNLSQDGDSVNFRKPDSKQEVNCVSENNFSDRLIEDMPMVELAKLSMEQASPVSVLDDFYAEDIPFPVKKKPNAYNDYDNLCVDETERNHAGIYNLVTGTEADEFQQTELLNSTDFDTINGDHKYIREILSALGFLKDPYSAFKIAQLHSIGSLIKPELFNILEKTNYECYKNNPSSKSVEKVHRKLIFDSVDDILFRKLAFFEKRFRRFMDGEKLLTELWLEIDNLQSGHERCMNDDNDDEVKIIVSADLSKDSQDWGSYCYEEVTGLVLDIERLIFKDLIDEIVNAGDEGVQDRRGRHCRRLFTM